MRPVNGMSILGDVPITAFFSIKAGGGRKRTRGPQPTASSSSKKQKIEKPKPKVAASPEETSSARENPSHSSRKVHAHGNGSGQMDSIFPPETPGVKFQKKEKVCASLQTPPTTIERSSGRPNTRAAAREAANLKSSISSSIPTPTTLPHSQPRRSQTPPSNVDNTPCKSLNNVFPTPNSPSYSHNRNSYTDSELPESPQSYRWVPSSQSQDGIQSYDHIFTSPIPSTPRQRSKDSHHNTSLDTNPAESTTPHRTTRSLRFPSVGEFDEIILSSQSQLIDPFDISPRRERPATKAMNAKSISVESIPSSQAHERVSGESKEHLLTYGLEDQDSYQHSLSSSNFSSTLVPPHRTLSDELFSVPIQRNVLAGIFPREEGSSSNVNNSASCDEDSATESETESEEASSLLRRKPVSPQRHSQSANSLGSSCGSLPGPLQDFEGMFGSNDESYPPDFPMSLRL